MFESKYSKVLTIVLVIVIVAILGLLGFLGCLFQILLCRQEYKFNNKTSIRICK